MGGGGGDDDDDTTLGNAWARIISSYLDKQRDAVEASDDSSVVGFTGQDVQGAYSALYNLLHAHTVHIACQWWAIGADGSSLQHNTKMMHKREMNSINRLVKSIMKRFKRKVKLF